uniref:Junctional cadherin 5 associated n=1 Tax=Bos indicus x Bos taurus TaxID=30522 RepID=A0A4W2EFW7_BOBOX
MYSVEDLLISHGYKLSRKLPAPHEDDGERRQPARTTVPAGPGLLNGCDDGPAALPRGKASPGTGLLSDPESRRLGPRGHGERPSTAAAARISEAGFYHQPVLAWSSQPLTGRSHAYWRRREQEAREDPGGRGPVPSLPTHPREGPWEVGGRSEHVMKKAVWEDELGMAGPARWQDVSVRSWNQPPRLGRQMSDGVGEKLFQDLYPFMLGEHGLTSQSKGKSQSLPRVLSPESLSCMEVPIPLSDGHLPGVPKVPLQPPNCASNLESTRNPKKAGTSAPLPQPRFGRPLKPPSYGSQPHSKAGAENGSYTDSRQLDPGAAHSARTNSARQDLYGPDPGLEPPVYVPPPSYKSPPQPAAHPCPEEAVSRHEGRGRRVPQHPMERPAAGGQPLSGSRGAGSEWGASPCSPVGVPPQPHHTTAYDGSILIIPFDDPRIRHIKLPRPHGFWEDVKLDGAVPAPDPRSLQQEGAVWGPSGKERGPAPADPSPSWLWGQPPRNGENGSSPDQRDPCIVTQRKQPDVSGSPQEYPESLVSSPSPQGESSCEMQTQLRKFEAGLQPKRSSKKKTSETIFCLVSIPVKSESQLPGTDTNNNDLKQSASLQEQSVLSLSSTDLELQALTGSMATRTELPRPDPGGPGRGRQADDLRFPSPAKHRALAWPGPWPGHHFRDQQTQTSFAHEPQSLQPLPGERPGGSPDPVLPPRCLDPAPFEVQMHMALASSDPNQRPGAHSPKSQGSLSPSSNSAFSGSSWPRNQGPVPRASLGQQGSDGPGRRASPVSRGEVIKGETTGPCNSRQLFGQFLLKPVSRRPWDLISQLESFNKELQEEEGSSGSSSDGSGSEDSDTELPWGSCARPAPQLPGLLKDIVPEDPRTRPGRVKSKSESWSEEGRPRSPRPWQAEGRGSMWLSPPGSWIAEDGDREVEDRVAQLAVSPRPVKRAISSGLNDAKPEPPPDPAEQREPLPSQELPGSRGAVELSAAGPPRAGGGEQGSTRAPLSLAGKSRGLSAPDLRSVGLTLVQEHSTSQLAGSPGDANAIEIPPNESLEARAARILGIEVAVESLLPGAQRAGQRRHPEPDGSALRPESPRQEAAASLAQPNESTAPADAFYGRRKCGWIKSPLFVGERDSTRQVPRASEPADVDGAVPTKAPETPPSPLESQPFLPKDVETKPPFRSTLFHFIERTPNLAFSEKKLRNTSRVIESLQEKLVSPPRKADPDRLTRMKEVSSVSRMRLLTSRAADSAEEPKAERGPGAWLGGLVAPSAGHKLSDPQGALSLEADGHPAARRENGGRDFWCPDSYDPSRVERV